MLRFTNLTMRNFLSMGNVTQAICLDANSLTLVLGQNTDANGATMRNGAGKTTILQAICYALFGWPLTKIKIPNLVNNVNGKGMLVTIEFEKDGIQYRIERGRKPDIFRYMVNGAEWEVPPTDEAQGENRETQKEIERVVGMTREMFKQIVALNTFTIPFLLMGAAAQREIIEELLGITLISNRAEALKQQIDTVKKGIEREEERIKATIQANVRIENAIDASRLEKERWDKNHAARLADIKLEIEAIEGINFEAEIAAFDAIDAWVNDERNLRIDYDAANREAHVILREIGALDSQIRAAQAELSSDGSAQIARLEGEKARRRAEIERRQADRVRHTEQAEALRVRLAEVEATIASPSAHSCDSCGQTLEGTEHLAVVIANLEKQVTRLRADIAEHESRTKTDDRDLVVEIEHLDAEIAGVASQVEAKHAEARARIAAINTERDAKVASHAALMEVAKKATAALQNLPPKPTTIFESRDEVYRVRQEYNSQVHELEVETAKVNPYIEQITSLTSTLAELEYDEMNRLKHLLAHQEFLLNLLTKKDSFIRKAIIDQNLAFLNSRLAYYLERLGLPQEVKFQSDLSVEIALFGRDMDFEQLSRGEMNRVIMSLSWAFRDIWESLNHSINLLWVDELIDSGLDHNGAEAALAIMKSMARDRKKNVFLISHRDELVGRIDRTLMVTKNNGFTQFEFDQI